MSEHHHKLIREWNTGCTVIINRCECGDYFSDAEAIEIQSAELAQLRATNAALQDSLAHWADLWSHICQRLGGDAEMLPSETNFDAMAAAFLARNAELEQTVNEARSAIDHALFFLASIDGYANGSAATGLRAWLAAHPAQQAEQEQTSPISAAEQDMIDSWHERM